MWKSNKKTTADHSKDSSISQSWKAECVCGLAVHVLVILKSSRRCRQPEILICKYQKTAIDNHNIPNKIPIGQQHSINLYAVEVLNILKNIYN